MVWSYLPTLPIFTGDSRFSLSSHGFLPGSQFSRISPDLWQMFALFFLSVILNCFWNWAMCIIPTVSYRTIIELNQLSFLGESSLCSRHSLSSCFRALQRKVIVARRKPLEITGFRAQRCRCHVVSERTFTRQVHIRGANYSVFFPGS